MPPVRHLTILHCLLAASLQAGGPARGAGGMAATQEALATREAVAVLARGGNAVDAAVAAGFVLAATLPHAGNLGGGGFMVLHLAEEGRSHAIDYRETAPLSAHRDMFLDQAGGYDPGKARYTRHSAGVPGTVAGLSLALERFGTLPLAEVLQPAIRLAEEGFPVPGSLASMLASERDRLARCGAAREVFFRPGGTAPLAEGERLVQPDLAWSLKQIARHGPGAFYRGAVAERVVADMEAHGGGISREDLARYRAVLRRPVGIDYRGHRVVSMPPPSSGGILLVQMLHMLEEHPLEEMGPRSPDTLHLLAECMKPAYADRSLHLGDPDRTPIPLARLLSRRYALKRHKLFRMDRAAPSDSIAPGLDRDPLSEGPETTHFSVIDAWGNAVASTFSLNLKFGSGIMPAGTGFFLNNQMDDFSSKPGTPNFFGLVGGEANSIAPGKRMLSSMSPTLILGPQGEIAATGSPGGSRIITTVLQTVVNLIDHRMDPHQAAQAPRIHHQWLPDVLELEEGFPPGTRQELESRGHSLRDSPPIGVVQTVSKKGDRFQGASDPRWKDGLALAVRPEAGGKP